MSSSGNRGLRADPERRAPLLIRDYTWLKLMPALVVIVPLFAAAFILAVIQSLGYFPLIGLRSFNVDAYRSLFGNDEFWLSLLLSTRIAFMAALLSTVLGIAMALGIRGIWRVSRRSAFLFQLSLPIPHVIGALAMVHLLGQSGLIARLGRSIGVVDAPSDFPALVYDPFALGIVAEFVWKDAPFVAIVALGVLGTVAENYESVAASLGASSWQRLRHVTLPLLVPAVAPISVIVFAFAFGSFEVPLLLGESFPSALPVLAYRLHTNVDLASRPEAMALAVVMSLVVMGAAVAYLTLVRRVLRGERT
jgi:putative spermidine/putrescine transport system permease protein